MSNGAQDNNGKGTYLEAPIAQATGHQDHIINVYGDHVEIKSGWQSQNVEKIGLRDLAAVRIRGVVNCTLTLETNTGRAYQIERLARPDAGQVKRAIESQKQKAGLYE